MAEIPIEPRHRSKRWLWILLILVLLLVLAVGAWWLVVR